MACVPAPDVDAGQDPIGVLAVEGVEPIGADCHRRYQADEERDSEPDPGSPA